MHQIGDNLTYQFLSVLITWKGICTYQVNIIQIHFVVIHFVV